MSQIRRLRRNLKPRYIRTAKILAKLQAVEPNPKLLAKNFEAIFNQVFAPQQTHVETYEPKPTP